MFHCLHGWSSSKRVKNHTCMLVSLGCHSENCRVGGLNNTNAFLIVLEPEGPHQGSGMVGPAADSPPACKHPPPRVLSPNSGRELPCTSSPFRAHPIMGLHPHNLNQIQLPPQSNFILLGVKASSYEFGVGETQTFSPQQTTAQTFYYRIMRLKSC